MSKKTRKRFIAGATCPKCKAQDSIMLYFENNVEKLQCVKCDYHDVQSQTDVAQAGQNSADVIGVFKP
ncbi:YheV family putative zinc ribbon protein [Opacimonas viscosa]|uniref:YheV family putative metal-binding protein n=1 Tax=Opacimonas viscosa TaxID=2961944 RepID=A0AA41X6S0_9ALTE|nr:YheV family putative zinc ribbon protein [Opacimonas viscosa]MCP3429614.1 YheV family putative metal-binding protein [Opacimonas viscosa]